jgi:short-subunit dehydrogenase
MLAIITGASSGIGKELAFQLAKKNYDLILVSRSENRLKEIKKNLIEYNIDVQIKVYDLSILDNCKLLIDDVKNLNIDLLFNNAGFGIYGYSNIVDVDKELNMIDLNIKSLHYLTKAAIKQMEKGQIINVSSMAAFLPTPLLSSYAATKAYVYSYSQALRYELKKQKIPINIMTVCPGPVKTNFNQNANASPKMKGIDVSDCVKSIMIGLKKRKGLVIPSFKMKLLKLLLKVTPNHLVMKIAHKIQSKK